MAHRLIGFALLAAVGAIVGALVTGETSTGQLAHRADKVLPGGQLKRGYN